MTIKQWEEAYGILEASFEPNELRGKEAFLALRDHPNFRLHTVEKEGHMDGMIGYWLLDGFCFVEYLALRSECRGKGTGSSLLHQFLSYVDQTVFLEVDPPGTDVFSMRRIRFYERAGFVMNDYFYKQPAYCAEKKPLVMKVMTYPAALSQEEFYRMRDCVYHTVYADQIRNNPSQYFS